MSCHFSKYRGTVPEVFGMGFIVLEGFMARYIVSGVLNVFGVLRYTEQFYERGTGICWSMIHSY